MKPEESKTKTKRCTRKSTCWKFVLPTTVNLPILFYFHSGSVSSYNDEDYEVDENSDDEEQEDPNDYCKGR